jgi:hypothetical protein
LDLAALRAGRPARPDGATTFSRRAVLGMAGAATVGASPALKVLDRALRGTFELVGDQHRVAFVLDGEERWVIDTRRFAGSPRLKIERREGGIRVQLTGARYPGTGLRADLVCRLRQGLTGWKMQLRLALGGFTAEAPLEKWLLGEEPLTSAVALRPTTTLLGNTSALALGGPGRATFAPTWELRLTGPEASLRGLGSPIASNTVTISLLEPQDPGITRRPVSRRTAIVLERGARSWDFEIARHARETWKLVTTASPFDVVRLELGTTRLGATRAALLAETEQEDSALFFQPEGKLTTVGGKPFLLPLVAARYAVSFDARGDERALVAEYGHPVWLHVQGCSLEVGVGDGIAPFELLGTPDGTERLRCAPALLTMTLPLEGAVSVPTRAGKGKRLVFVTDPHDGEHNRHGSNQVSVRLRHRLRAETVIANPQVDVIRPQDLLVLSFGFQNLNLNPSSTSGGMPTLTVADTTSAAYVGVQFPPQAIQEQAVVVSGSTPYQLPSPLPSAGNTTTELSAWAAQPSQLIFSIPNPSASTSINFTLADLLNWNPWTLSVVPDAVPPGGFPPRNGSLAFPFYNQPAQPSGTQTAIAAPYRLALSPPGKLDTTSTPDLPAWAHSSTEVTQNTARTEIWHTRYAVKSHVDGSIQEMPPSVNGLPPDMNQPDQRLTLRAVWSPDFPTPAADTTTDPAYIPANPTEVSTPLTTGVSSADQVRDLEALDQGDLHELDAADILFARLDPVRRQAKLVKLDRRRYAQPAG